MISHDDNFNNNNQAKQENQSLQNILADDDLDGPLTEESSQEQEYIESSVQGTNVKKGTLILCIAFAVGIAVIFLMMKKTTPQAASAAATTDNAQIELALAKLTGIKTQAFDQMDDIDKKFKEFSNVYQVPVAQLKGNPFLSGRYIDSQDENSDNINQSFDFDVPLSLGSIAKSQDGDFCIINGKFLFVGDSINNFKVIKIGSNFVKLKSALETKTLKMSMP